MITNNPTPRNVAFIAITKTSPASLNLTPNDPRVKWTIDDPTKADFFTLPNGQKDDKGRFVRVFGKTEGRVLLTATLTDDQGKVACETYEAQVVEEKQIPFRVNLLHGEVVVNGKKEKIGTIVKLKEAENHIAIANVYLRQIGVRLVPDQDKTEFDGAKLIKKDKPGFFEATVDDPDLVRFVERLGDAIRVNDRDKVVQITYIQSLDSGALGETANHPGNSNANNISLKYRIIKDEGARQHTMKLFDTNGEALRDGEPFTWGILISNGSGQEFKNGKLKKLKSEEAAPRYGKVIAHEVPHIMNLGHREPPANDPISDELNQPKDMNLMDVPFNPAHEDLDLIQSFGARGSDALK